jgi:hypothetical protein
MSAKSRIEKLEGQAARVGRLAVEDLTDEQLDAIVKGSGYDLSALTDAELTALCACYTDAGDYRPERMTPELTATLERVKL